MWLGIDYYPEHWPEDLLEADLERIVDLGANAIRIGEFAWHLIEPKPGQFDFSFFDRVIAAAKTKGLAVIYGTPTATFPAWLLQMYPMVLSMDEKGQRRSFGGRRVYCYNSPEYRAMSLKMVEALVKHYSTEEAIMMWQIDNELGHEGSDDCYCPHCESAFQVFLKDRYQRIDQLNATYGTIFWGQTYNDFNQVPMPLPTITTHNPVLKLDWARFRSQSIYDFAFEQIQCVRLFKGHHQHITHNYFGGYFDRRYDQTRLSRLLDVVSFDNYPVWGGLMTPMTPAEIALGHDYMRGLKKQNFWVMEQLIGAQGHNDIGYLPRAGQSTLWASQAMARGCEALFYFRYRGFHKGAEQYCQGILDSDNAIGDKYTEVQKFFKKVIKHEALLKSRISAKLAVVYDYDNRWSWYGQRQSKDFDYSKEILRNYRPFHRLNLSIDVINVTHSWEDYAVLVMPVMQLMDQSLADRIKQFVFSGGTLLLSYRSAIKDKDNNLVFGEKAPVYLNEVVGVTVKTFEALADERSVAILEGNQVVGQGTVWRDLLEPQTAQVIYTYDSPYRQYAACTVNSYGDGKVYYIASGLDDHLMDLLAEKIAEEAKLDVLFSEDGVEVVARTSGGEKAYWVLNHNTTPTVWRGHPLEGLEVRVIKESSGEEQGL